MSDPDLPCLCILTRQVSRKLTAVYDEALAPTGINIAQFSLLRKLRRYGPSSLSALASLADLDRSTLGRNLRVLEKMNLVALIPGKDKRESVAALTDQGAQTIKAGDPIWDRTQDEIANKIGSTGIGQLQAMLEQL